MVVEIWRFGSNLLYLWLLKQLLENGKGEGNLFPVQKAHLRGDLLIQIHILHKLGHIVHDKLYPSLEATDTLE
jgi:hypothetical protein